MPETSIVAATALLIWPLVTLALFAGLGPVRGLIWATLVGYLFLPEGYKFDLPGLPDYSKYSAIAFAILAAAFLLGRRKAAGGEAAPGDRVLGDRRFRIAMAALAAVLLVAGVFTILDNRFPIPTGTDVRPALGLRDLVSFTAEIVIALVPFFLARHWLATPRDHTLLLAAMVALGIVYSLLALFEVRMSPQLNRWVYGYFPHSWLQHVRGGGYRPLVFLEHGLWLGFFQFMAMISAFALARQGTAKTRTAMFLAGLYLFVILAVSRNLGALMLAVVFVPVVLFLSARMQVRVAVATAVLFLAYPALRQSELVPVAQFTEAVAGISDDRARSLDYRLTNETNLLRRAYEKPVFGWGGWARAQIFDERGRRASVTDGTWIIVIGERGWVGYLAFFGLLTLPLLHLRRALRRKGLPPATLGLAAIAAGNLIYMIPNATLTPVNWLIFGALAGFVQWDARRAGEQPAAAAPPPARRSRYTRFGPDDALPDAPGRPSRFMRRE